MHDHVLGRIKEAHIVPGADLAGTEGRTELDSVAGILIEMVIDVVADHQIHLFAAVVPVFQIIQQTAQGPGIQPVIRIHHLEVFAGGIAQSLVHAFAVTRVGLMHHLDDVRILFVIAVCDLGSAVTGTIVHQYDLHPVSTGEQCFNAAVHIAFGVIAGYRKCNVLHIVLPTHFLRAFLRTFYTTFWADSKGKSIKTSIYSKKAPETRRF